LLAISSLVGATPVDIASEPSFLGSPTRVTGDVHVEREVVPLDPIRKRQTNSKEILRRATRRLTAPRAYISTLPCGGYAGQTAILQVPGTGYVGPSSSPTNSINALATVGTATWFTFNSVCQLVTSNGAILNTHSTGEADFLYLNTDVTRYSPLTCNGDSSNALSCTRFSPAVAGNFCTNPNQAVDFGQGCQTTTTFVPVLVDA
ncbi:hypothetical protein DB88DRAFT_503289, partial [Papiliotrema laurentii]